MFGRNRPDRDDRKRLRADRWAALASLIGLLIYLYSVFVLRCFPGRGGSICLSDKPGEYHALLALLMVMAGGLIAYLGGGALLDLRHRARDRRRMDRWLRRDLEALAASNTSRPMTSPAFVIAVDGPAASGKGTIAARLARLYGLPHMDTGLLYRAAGLKALAAGVDLDDAAAAAVVAGAVTAEDLADETALTSRGAGEAASRVAVHAGVRAALLKLQQDFARRPGGAVLDGRDIGTVIAPEAPVKLFITAAAKERARRRWRQLTGRGETMTYEDMLADIVRRDERDAGRGAAPMVQAADAVLLDTTDMDIEAAFDAARRIVEAARVRHGL